MRTSLFLVSAMSGVLLLSGCTIQGAGPGTNASETPTPTSVSHSPSPSSTPSPTSTRVDPNAPEGQCENENLSVEVEHQSGAAGSRYSNILFTNTGSAECALSGYPGVSVVGHGNGTQLGAPADRNAADGLATVRLEPGSTAIAVLQETNINDNGGPLAGSCDVETGDGYRIYPPHSFDAVFVEESVAACASGTVWMHVGPSRRDEFRRI
jgi:hypothetical protein